MQLFCWNMVPTQMSWISVATLLSTMLPFIRIYHSQQSCFHMTPTLKQGTRYSSTIFTKYLQYMVVFFVLAADVLSIIICILNTTHQALLPWKQLQSQVTGWRKVVLTERAQFCLPATLLPQKGNLPIRICLGVGGGLRAHTRQRPGGREMRWGLAACRGSRNGCCWGWMGGGRRPSTQQGELGECRWPGQAAGPEPSRTPGSNIGESGAGRV